MTTGYVDDKALRDQALRLTQSVYLKMKIKPTTPPEKVAPIVYVLLRDGVAVDHIEMALKETKALTRAGIDYTLATLVPRQSGMKPKMEPVAPLEWDPPTDEQKARAREEIAIMRARLRGV